MHVSGGDPCEVSIQLDLNGAWIIVKNGAVFFNLYFHNITFHTLPFQDGSSSKQAYECFKFQVWPIAINKHTRFVLFVYLWWNKKSLVSFYPSH